MVGAMVRHRGRRTPGERRDQKSAAETLFRGRKTEVRQGVKFPETMRQRDARLRDLVADYLEAIRASQVKTADAIARQLAEVVGILANVEAKSRRKRHDDVASLEDQGARLVTRLRALQGKSE